MAIDLHNYEAYLLDFFEGRLSAAQVAELQAFVLAHPELQIDLNDGSLPVVEPIGDTISTFSFRKDLPGADEKRALEYVEGLMAPDEKENFTELLAQNAGMRALVQCYEATRLTPGAEQVDRSVLMIDEPTPREIQVLEYREGLMSAQQQLDFERLMERDAGLSVLNGQFARCEISADRSVVFEGKNELLRSPRVISLRATVLRAAASILLIAMLTILIWEANDNTGSHVATNPVITQSSINSQPEVPHQLPPDVAVSNAPLETPSSESTVAMKHKSKQSSVLKERTSLAAIANEPDPKISEPQKDVSVDEPQNSDLAMDAAPSQSLVTTLTKDSALGSVVYGLENLAVVDEEPLDAERNGFWEKAARLAKQMGKFGLKGVEANTGDNSVTLSLNELSVEKKYARL